MQPEHRRPPTPISLLISDVDGTLVTKAKELTPATLAAVAALRRAGIAFTVVSSRPPRGLSAVLPPLDITLPYGGFNGGSILESSGGAILEQQSLPPAIARQALEFLASRNVSAWVFAGQDWLVRDLAGPYVDHERQTVRFDPVLVSDFDDALLANVGKIVGASEDFAYLAACETDLQDRLGDKASVHRSQTYYLDITHPRATKGNFLHALSRRLAIPPHEIAVIGDMANDVSMFHEAGLSIAMGNATEAVKMQASAVTDSNGEDGFAKAVERFILPQPQRGAFADGAPSLLVG